MSNFCSLGQVAFLAAKCKGIFLDIVKWHRRQEENSVQRERSERIFFEVYLRERSEQKNFKVPSRHHAIMPSCHHAIMPSCHHAIMPSCHHAIMPSCHHAIMPSCHHAIMPSCHHAIMPSCHHAIMPSCHHAIMPSCHHAIMPSCHHAIMPSGGKSPGDGERKPCPTTPRGMMVA